MKKIFGLIYDDMAAFEVTLVHYLLKRFMDMEIILIAHEKRDIVAKSGMTFKPDLTVKEALEVEDVQGLIIPGGWNDEQREELTELIQKLDRNKSLLAAICRGPSYLARAGVLKNRPYTTTYSEKLVEELGVEDPFNRTYYQDTFVVRDENIITSKGTAFVDFSMEICNYFHMFKNDEERRMVTETYKGNR